MAADGLVAPLQPVGPMEFPTHLQSTVAEERRGALVDPLDPGRRPRNGRGPQLGRDVISRYVRVTWVPLTGRSPKQARTGVYSGSVVCHRKVRLLPSRRVRHGAVGHGAVGVNRSAVMNGGAVLDAGITRSRVS